MGRIFLSYSHSNKEVINTILTPVQELFGKESIWYDAEIFAGQNWEEVIREKIEECEVFICLLSTSYFKSEICMLEIRAAIRLNKSVLPILIHADIDSDVVPEDLKNFFQKTQYINWTPAVDGSRKITNLIKSLKRFLGTKSLAASISSRIDGKETLSVGVLARNVFEEEHRYRLFFSDGNSSSSLEDLFREILQADICIFDFSVLKPGLLVEFGIALALYKYIRIIHKEKSSIPVILEGYHRVEYQNPSDLLFKLTGIARNERLRGSLALRDYCHFCDITYTCEFDKTAHDFYLIAGYNKHPWNQLGDILEPHLQDISPKFLSENPKGAQLCSLHVPVRESRFLLFGMGDFVTETGLLSLGIAIGSLKEILVVRGQDEKFVPDFLRNYYNIEYAPGVPLENSQNIKIQNFLAIASGILSLQTSQLDIARNRTVRAIETGKMKLESILTSLRPTAKPRRHLKSDLVILKLSEGKVVDKREMLPSETKLICGRDPAECNIIVNTPSASRVHFQITRGAALEYFIEDMESGNGTFLNGVRLKSREEIYFKDIIRAGGQIFWVWEQKTKIPSGDLTDRTTELGHRLIKVDFADVVIPKELDIDLRIVLNISYPDGGLTIKAEVQAYCPVGRILAALSKPLGLPEFKHFFMKDRTLIDEDKTPLQMGLTESTLLTVVADKAEKAMRVTYALIKYCGNAHNNGCQTRDEFDQDQEGWRRGEKMGTLQELFESRYEILYNEKPPSGTKVRSLTCPNCKNTIYGNTPVGR